MNCNDLMQKIILSMVKCIHNDLFLLFFSKVGSRMCPSFKLVLLVTALTCVWTQDLYEERKTNKKSRAKPVAANINNGQGKIENKMNKQNNSSFWHIVKLKCNHLVILTL